MKYGSILSTKRSNKGSVGTAALVDEDDGQKEGSFDMVIGLVYCGNDNINNKKSLNELLLEGGYAVFQDLE